MKEPVVLNGKTILITGAAGFIGAALTMRLLREVSGAKIIGLDDLNNYYDVSLKKYRLDQIAREAEESSSVWSFVKQNISDAEIVKKLFEEERPSVVVNLAAQAGVRYSIEYPEKYLQSNVIGFYNILEACKEHRKDIEHLIYASSSSVYGENAKLPFSPEDKTDEPLSLYAATKKSNELFAHCYAKLFDIPATGLRFFTVYGPGGRPDMFYFSMINKLLKNEKITVYNYGNCSRDFTYIDDIVEGVFAVIKGAPQKASGNDGLPIPPHKVYNIGRGKPESLMTFIDILQREMVEQEILPKDYNFEAHKEYVEMQPGDVPVTFADTTALEQDYGYVPQTEIKKGLHEFVKWYKDYYAI